MKAILIMDNFTGQKPTSIMEKLEQNDSIVIMVPGRCTDCLHPLDTSINKPAKYFLRDCGMQRKYKSSSKLE